ncbi:hypothetical protein Ndes2526B_g07194 [Nannochloris sp. 'desiccata']
MRRSTLLLALALVLAVASPAFASDDDKFFLSHKFDLHKKLFKSPTGATGPKPLFHHLFGRKMLAEDGDDEANADFFLFKGKLDKIKELLPTGAWKIHAETEETEEVEPDSLFHGKLDKLKKLLPTGAWTWHAEEEDVEGQFFLPKHKLDKLKKLLPTGHWKWDSDAEALATHDEKTFLLHKFAKKILATGTHTGAFWKH